MSRFKPYWKNHGGITVSGGEPLSQLDFLVEFARLCHQNGVSLAIDTAGGPFNRNSEWLRKFDELLSYCTLFLLDMKVIDPDQHKKLVGADNKNVLDLFAYLSEKKFPIWIRRVLVPGWNDQEEYLKKEGEFFASLSNIKRIEVLPYHTLGTFKYEKLGIPYPLKGVNPPSLEAVEKAKTLLRIAELSKE